MQFIRFCFVGGCVFCIDFVLFNWLVESSVSPFLARWSSFCVAIYFSWLGNSYFTFKQKKQVNEGKIYSLCMFFIMSHSTGIFNLAVYSYAVYLGVPLNVSFLLGVKASLFLNYFFSRKVIFSDDILKYKRR
ncbi:GtrA family protein [Pseudoalteromonas luteoviolacea]|uniref:GtrA/DPMS transmembrane domain-containing protein n=1 Tax=Pseudoalteromonas luteoviolacea S4054 TaxID=1129367 RepID=A0A0F6AAR5_9GAMM|nr:GtrA family protein [Pseudoalteromonas luteoviolacea]AOT08685.1 hypothetical protein S4054249_12845 [Pseudoalteromonas luteoviolacea]AOT13600.1 hypothetical protein S40542_12820 [Pseudoalteromonas luteoviolacea]AOT18513.1 hypothetical protein S4054_12820 [Pseudoalteromonas luteoviolacea]KKE82479.1 hypothetical protein N479_17895 [Pseudoalteromonas luteoviolacea S4054]KZN72016.1 hypothetical protein N481_16530 [Pseudoalteromonas luteoviolacea S4047-1]